MSDLISRADAIEAVAKLNRYDVDERNRLREYTPFHGLEVRTFIEVTDLYDALSALPSAELPKGDLISRADVLKYPIRLNHYDEENGSREFVYGVESVIEYVESLPSADAVSREEYDKLIQELNDSPKGRWIPLDGKLPKIIGDHVLVTIKWADDDLEVCEMCPTNADRYNIIAFQKMPLPYDGEPLKSELQTSCERAEKTDDTDEIMAGMYRAETDDRPCKTCGYYEHECPKDCEYGRPQGEWQFRNVFFEKGMSMGYVCSNCGKDYFHVDGFDFCPSCGADMRGDKND